MQMYSKLTQIWELLWRDLWFYLDELPIYSSLFAKNEGHFAYGDQGFSGREDTIISTIFAPDYFT